MIDNFLHFETKILQKISKVNNISGASRFLQFNFVPKEPQTYFSYLNKTEIFSNILSVFFVQLVLCLSIRLFNIWCIFLPVFGVKSVETGLNNLVAYWK